MAGPDAPEPAEPTEPAEVPDRLPTLALLNAEQQLRYLDCEVFAAADDEAIEALTSIALHELWALAYTSHGHEQQVLTTCQTYNAQRPWSARVQQMFLQQYQAARAVTVPGSYRFKVGGQIVEPRLMQRHVAAMAHERRRLLVLSDMGTGKSLAAQLAVLSDNAKRILVLPINACSHQWSDDFRNQWSGIRVHTDAASLPDLGSSSDTNVWVIPIHLLSRMDDDQADAIVKHYQPDAIILDEVQFLKQRHDDRESARRKQAATILCLATAANPEAMVLSLSGTAVVNNLTEAKKLIELTLCEQRPDLHIAANVANAMRMHQALMANGIRQRAANLFPHVVIRPDVDATDLTDGIKFTQRYPSRERPLRLERVLIEARIPAVVAAIKGRTIVATQYVEGFVDPLRAAIEEAGYRVGVHTGEEQLPIGGYRNAIEAFKAGDLDVLLASINTLGTGVDGLQHVCSNLVIASMPWTAADYQQLIARLARSGQQQTVRVTIPTTSVMFWDEEEGLQRWSYCEQRAALIDCKQRLMDAVMDGLIPEDEAAIDSKAEQQLARWLARLNSAGALVRRVTPLEAVMARAADPDGIDTLMLQEAIC